MQTFLKIERVAPEARKVLERIKDYHEVYTLYEQEGATLQASRCVQCGNPYCHHQCPLHNFIPQWLQKIAQKDLPLAFSLSNATSPFPEIMGRVCPQDRLCEGACTLNDKYGAVSIGAIETFISEEGLASGYTLPKPKRTSLDKKIAIIGSGPAGLSAATFLLREGFIVEMFEREERAGGLLTYGIPSFKLEKSVVQRRVETLIAMGLKLHLRKEVGKDISFAELQERFDAIFLGIGATLPNRAQIPNENAAGCYAAMEFLVGIQKRLFDAREAFPSIHEKHVIVIGGGDTAMDCARTAVREGAKSVRILYRRDEASMPGSKKEYKNAKEEGVEFGFLTAPKEVVVENGRAVALITQKTELKENPKGRTECLLLPKSEMRIEADLIIFSLGFFSDKPEFLEAEQIKRNERGDLLIDANYETSIPHLFAGGDCQRGADLVVNAALDGREAARSITRRFLGDLS